MRKVEMTELRLIEAGGDTTSGLQAFGTQVASFLSGICWDASAFAKSGKKFLVDFGTWFDMKVTLGINVFALFGLKWSSLLGFEGILQKEFDFSKQTTV